MLSIILTPVRAIAKALVANDSPRQLALALTIGMIIGFMPKGNLLAAGLMALLFTLRVNRSIGLVSILAFSWVGSLTDPIAHKIGNKLLGIESLQPTFAWLYDQPIGPWIGFNNTVIVGSLLLGLYIAYPTYWLSCIAFKHLQGRATQFVRRYKIIQMLVGIDITSRLGVTK